MIRPAQGHNALRYIMSFFFPDENTGKRRRKHYTIALVSVIEIIQGSERRRNYYEAMTLCCSQ